MGRRTQHALIAASVAVLTAVAYLPNADLYRVSPSSSRSGAQSAGTRSVRVHSGTAWRSRPVTVALSRTALLVPLGSRAARVTTVLTIAAAAVTALAATTVLGLGASTSAAMASALGLAWSAPFAAQATTPASNLAEAALCLALIGLCVSKARKHRWTPLLSIACGAMIVALGIAAIEVPLYILIGLCMSWFVGFAAPYGRRAATVMIFLVPLLSAAERYGAVRKAVDSNALAAAVAEALPGALPVNGVVAASDSRSDQLHGFWQLGMPSPRLIAPTASAAKRAYEEGYEVFAVGSSRRRLEETGLSFATEPLLETTILLEDYFEQLPFRSIAVVGFGPKAASDLAASAPFYGSIGIIGPFGLQRPLERRHRLPVDLSVEAGDPIGSTVLAPVPMRVFTDDGGILIDVDRRYVLQAADGMALAVVTPSGAVSAAHRIDTGMPLAVPIDPLEMQIGRLRGAQDR